MLEKINKLFKKDQTEFDGNADFDVDRKFGKKPKFTVKKKVEDDNVDLNDTANFDDNSDFDIDKKLNKKDKSKDKKRVKEDNADFDDSVDFDLDQKLSEKDKSKGKKKVIDVDLDFENNAKIKDDKQNDYTFDAIKEKKKIKFKFKFKWWMLIPIVLILAIVITIVVIGTKETAYGNEVSQVSISSLPEKLVYYVGEQPTYTGFSVTTIFNNGTSISEGPEACTFSGFNSEFPEEEQRITVTYGEYTFVYTITIKEPVRPFSPLVKISLETLPKTEYKVGDWLNVNDGVLLLEYEDGSTRRIRLEHNHIYDFSTENPGNFTITVKLREDGFLATCTYNITVTE